MSNKGGRNFNIDGDQPLFPEKAIKDIDLLLKQNNGYISSLDRYDLHEKYPNSDILESEIEKRTKQYNKDIKHAYEVAQKVYKRYSESNLPFHEILKRVIKYKEKNKWTDSQFEEFRKKLIDLYEGKKLIQERSIVEDKYDTKIKKFLGMSIQKNLDTGIKLKDGDIEILKEVLSMHTTSAALHKSVFMNSLTYTDCHIVAMTGKFNRDKHLATNYIHPLIACMFLPKFEIFELCMLHSNFGSIIKARYEKKQVQYSDYLLFNNIAFDQNDIVCHIDNPLLDIKYRYIVQIALWELVLKLRNGNYYECEQFNKFLSSLSICRNNLYDNADLSFNQDEGGILKRLMSVFSLRPTIVNTQANINIPSINNRSCEAEFNFDAPGIGFGVREAPVVTTTKIPLIHVNIPPYKPNCEPIDLKTNQTIWINENGVMIPKRKDIVHSAEVLIYYVNRRDIIPKFNSYANPIKFSHIPLTMSSYEKMNPYPINVSPFITLNGSDETFFLRSVNAVTETSLVHDTQNTKIITGSVGLIISKSNNELINQGQYYLYDPFGASIPVANPDRPGEYFNNNPISLIEPYFSGIGEAQGNSFYERASRSGTIFIYAKNEGYSLNNMQYQQNAAPCY